MLVDEQLICGLQIHVGVSDRDLAVEIMQRVARDLPDPARPVGQLAVLERAGHRLRQHPLDHLAALAERRRDRPAALGPRLRRDARRPDQHRGHRGRQDGLLRRTTLRARPDPGAAHLRRLPDHRRRRADRGPVPGHRARRRAGHQARPPILAGAPAGASRGDLAGRPGRSVRRAAGRHPAPQAGAGRSRGEGPGQAAAPSARGAGRLGGGPRAGQDDPGPRQLGGPAAGRVRRAGPTERRGGTGRAGDSRTARRTRTGGARAAPVPVPSRRRGRRTQPSTSADLPRPDRLFPQPRRPQSARPQAGPRGLDRPIQHDVRGRGREAAVLGRPDAAPDQPARVAGAGQGPDPARAGDRDVPPRRVRRAADRRRRGALPGAAGGFARLARRGAPGCRRAPCGPR